MGGVGGGGALRGLEEGKWRKSCFKQKSPIIVHSLLCLLGPLLRPVSSCEAGWMKMSLWPQPSVVLPPPPPDSIILRPDPVIKRSPHRRGGPDEGQGVCLCHDGCVGVCGSGSGSRLYSGCCCCCFGCTVSPGGCTGGKDE